MVYHIDYNKRKKMSSQMKKKHLVTGTEDCKLFVLSYVSLKIWFYVVSDNPKVHLSSICQALVIIKGTTPAWGIMGMH